MTEHRINRFQWKIGSSGKIKENEVKTANREKIQQIQASTMRNMKDSTKLQFCSKFCSKQSPFTFRNMNEYNVTSKDSPI